MARRRPRAAQHANRGGIASGNEGGRLCDASARQRPPRRSKAIVTTRAECGLSAAAPGRFSARGAGGRPDLPGLPVVRLSARLSPRCLLSPHPRDRSVFFGPVGWIPVLQRKVAPAGGATHRGCRCPVARTQSAFTAVRPGDGGQEAADGRLLLGDLCLSETKLHLFLISVGSCSRQFVRPLTELLVICSKLLFPLSGCPSQCRAPAR